MAIESLDLIFTRALNAYSSSRNGARGSSKGATSNRLNITLAATITPTAIPVMPQNTTLLYPPLSLFSTRAGGPESPATFLFHQSVKFPVLNVDIFASVQKEMRLFV